MRKEKNRVAKIISESGLCSRRVAEQKIFNGEVSVNGHIIDSPALNVSYDDIISVNGQPLSKREDTKLYIYHKPAGLITSHNDENGRKTIFDDIGNKYGKLLSIGRLDLNSEGLLLLTNDGEFQRFMESPKNEFERIYKVRVHGTPSKDDILKLKNGITVDGIKYKKIDVKVDKVLSSNSWLTVKLIEGKNREIRKTLSSLGYEVNKLIRISYAGFELRNLEKSGIYEVKIPQKLLQQYENFKG
ncbi:rRNA pseudouridine synthase [bacterium]|nr:rRNA pseudouridine synthase [bacterium]